MYDFLLPNCFAIAQTFSSLMETDIQVDDCDPWRFSDDTCVCIATYKTTDGFIATVGTSDFIASTCLPAMLARMPKEAITKCLKDKSKNLSVELLDNMREVMNVFSTLLNTDGQPHLAINDLQTPLTPFFKPIIQSLARPASRVDFQVQFGEYGTGKLSYLVLPEKLKI